MKLLITTQAVDINHPILAFAIGWITEFSKHFAEVHVICLQKGTYELPSNVFVYSLGKENGESRLTYIVRFYRYFSYIFFKVKVEYVFFHMGAIYNILAFPFFIVRTFYKTSFFWWKAHGHINMVGKLALCFVDRVYTSTESGFPINTSKRHVVGQAIDTFLFVPPSSEEMRTKEIIFVGRIMPVKHLEDFIDTAQILLEVDPTITFTIIGPNGDAVYYKKQVEKISSLGLTQNIIFAGSKTQEELVIVYQHASVFLNTSRTHSMDKTVLEATLCGCIPVTSNKAFIDLLDEHGLYVENNSPDSYATVIKKLLAYSDSADLREQLQKAVIEKHSLATFSKRIFNV